MNNAEVSDKCFYHQHPGWSNNGRNGFPNDMAVVRLATPARIDGRTVAAATLPSQTLEDFTSSECWISGWGRTGGSEFS